MSLYPGLCLCMSLYPGLCLCMPLYPGLWLRLSLKGRNLMPHACHRLGGFQLTSDHNRYAPHPALHTCLPVSPFPLLCLCPGPAGGVVGYAKTTLGVETEDPVIGFDMGGTSTDVSRFDGTFEQVRGGRTRGVPHWGRMRGSGRLKVQGLQWYLGAGRLSR